MKKKMYLCFLCKAGDAIISLIHEGEGEKMSSGIKYFEMNMTHMKAIINRYLA